jgi:hypothetical protein
MVKFTVEQAMKAKAFFHYILNKHFACMLHRHIWAVVKGLIKSCFDVLCFTQLVGCEFSESQHAPVLFSLIINIRHKPNVRCINKNEQTDKKYNPLSLQKAYTHRLQFHIKRT